MTRSAPRPLVLLSLLALGCAGPGETVAELGYPAFTPVLKEARFWTHDRRELQGFAARGEDSTNEDHELRMYFQPLAQQGKIALAVQSSSKGKLGLKQILMAVYPLTGAQKGAFEAHGKLPKGVKPLFVGLEPGETKVPLLRPKPAAKAPAGKAKPLPEPEPLLRVRAAKQKKGHERALALVFPRRALPPGVEWLAIPTLVEFSDGWIYIRFLSTRVPSEPPQLSDAEAKAVQDALRKAGGARRR